MSETPAIDRLLAEETLVDPVTLEPLTRSADGALRSDRGTYAVVDGVPQLLSDAVRPAPDDGS